MVSRNVEKVFTMATIKALSEASRQRYEGDPSYALGYLEALAVDLIVDLEPQARQAVLAQVRKATEKLNKGDVE